MVGAVKLVVCGIGGVFCLLSSAGSFDINFRNFKVRTFTKWYMVY